jgi:hypothetical protein
METRHNFNTRQKETISEFGKESLLIQPFPGLLDRRNSVNKLHLACLLQDKVFILLVWARRACLADKRWASYIGHCCVMSEDRPWRTVKTCNILCRYNFRTHCSCSFQGDFLGRGGGREWVGNPLYNLTVGDEQGQTEWLAETENGVYIQ